MARRCVLRLDRSTGIADGMTLAGGARSPGAIDNAAHDTRRRLSFPGS